MGSVESIDPVCWQNAGGKLAGGGEGLVALAVPGRSHAGRQDAIDDRVAENGKQDAADFLILQVASLPSAYSLVQGTKARKCEPTALAKTARTLAKGQSRSLKPEAACSTNVRDQ